MIQWLNYINAERAESEFLKCCGSKQWARAMTAARPFHILDEVLETADSVWGSLREEDWLEAFRAHPRIGEKKAAVTQTEDVQRWSAEEQAGTQGAAATTGFALAKGNREYEERFGFVFIVCATGKSAAEMLAMLEERLGNDRERELRIAAEEQRKIMRLRLEKLLKR